MKPERYYVYVDGEYRGWLLEYDSRSAYAKARKTKGLGAVQVLIKKAGSKNYLGALGAYSYKRDGTIHSLFS